jgi:hypothetical protein
MEKHIDIFWSLYIFAQPRPVEKRRLKMIGLELD